MRRVRSPWSTEMKNILLRLAKGERPLRAVLARQILKRIPLLSYADRLNFGYDFVERPHYAHCIFHAAKLAHSLKYPKMSVIEFGCCGGRGRIKGLSAITEGM